MFTHDWPGELLGIGTILASFVCAWLMMDYHDFTLSPLKLDQEQTFYEVKKGATIHSLATDFENKGWIKNRNYLKVFTRLNELGSIKAGEYAISRDMTAIEALKLFVKGQVILHQLTFIEGWTFKQMLQAIEKHDKIKQTLAGLSGDEIMTKLGKPGLHPEGQFLPDTYKFGNGITDLELLVNAHDALEKTLDDAWNNRAENLPLNTPYEALTLASIVEKETGVGHERPLIAGVFTTRLRKNMKLQTDPTVIYGMGDRYKGNIKRKHLREDTPYNTYVHKGLTPTPISMPGSAAINAVMHPKEEGYIYFVAKADGSGSHYFSKTLKEHNNAVRKYQLKQ
ncbi:MAG: endolytic transglycosylase MltG [Gammaproteobacteria bacterium]|nr:endolytic transglycosylase MltG [Gammaproteobacteria bacterium]NNJ91050.1 endolytic transglycosylase MltG [Gammaproteobacteria bacterium]